MYSDHEVTCSECNKAYIVREQVRSGIRTTKRLQCATAGCVGILGDFVQAEVVGEKEAAGEAASG
jgi:hypothetical protein